MEFPPYCHIYKADPYFQEKYHQCYLREGEEVYDFEYTEGKDFLVKRAIKRPISKVGRQELENKHYDLETVYGFGGCITNSKSEHFVKKALEALRNDCLQKSIVASFMRFHPLNDFPLKYGALLNFCAENRRVIFINTRVNDYSEMKAHYSSSLKRNINKAYRNNLSGVKLAKNAETRERFMQLYYNTMERKDADDMYFFDEEYFHQLFNMSCLEVYGTLYEKRIISMILVLKSDYGQHYYHLGATDGEFYSLNPNPFILDYIAREILNNEGDFLFLGGGNANADDDPLFRFKKKFNKNSAPFFIGGMVFQSDIFEDLKELARKQTGKLPPQFLSYRFI